MSKSAIQGKCKQASHRKSGRITVWRTACKSISMGNPMGDPTFGAFLVGAHQLQALDEVASQYFELETF